MELYKVAAIARTVHEKILAAENEECRREWIYSIYYALMDSINNDVPELIWEVQHSQWNINHLFRGMESSLKRDHPSLVACISIITEDGNGVYAEGHLQEPGIDDEPFSFRLDSARFIPLEEAEYEGKRILFDSEGNRILDALLETEDVTEPQGDEQAQGRTVDKISALEAMLGPVRNIYADMNEAGINYIETVIGAALFYLPHPVNKCFSGYCSIDALNCKLSGRRIVKEHIIPRKYAAREILNENYDPDRFYNDFTSRYRRFMYLTPEENRMTVNYTEETHDDALVNLGIVKFPAADSLFVNNHTLFMNFIAFCRENMAAEDALDTESASDLLTEFRRINQV